MELKIFSFADKVLEKLDDMKIDLDIASREIEEYFEKVVEKSSEGYLNINSRVKSKQSLKEKILRYDYYNKCETIEALYENLSDLIGLRLECRFIEDEVSIYKFIKNYFTQKSERYEGFLYNEANPSILLELVSKQPKDQKNGVKMYRIDGKHLCQGKCINFELQIKSLVNIFWSEIEHKVIYKNYNYIIADRFYKDIMRSIKNSLTTIDQQLLLISNQFDRGDITSYGSRKFQLEQVLAKVIYDLFAVRMRNSIGILVDFRKSCDTIVKYVFRESLGKDSALNNEMLLMAFNRVNQIEAKEIDFNSNLLFERELVFKDSFSEIIGNFMKEVINEEFQWNLFFRILFEIEPENNAGDFENFIAFYKDRIYVAIDKVKIYSYFTQEAAEVMIEDMMIKFSHVFIQINSVEVLYETMIEKISKVFNGILEAIHRNVFTYAEWEKEKNMYLQLFEFRLLAIFNIDIRATEVLDLLEEVRSSEANIEIDKGILKYIDKL